MRKFIESILNRDIEILGFGEFGQHGAHESVFQKFNHLNGLFNGIFLEIPADFQESVDSYIKTKIFDSHFENLLRGAEKEGKYLKNTFSYLLDFARINDIPAICIDSSKTKDKEYFKKSTDNSSYLRGGSRDEDMYVNILEALDKYGGRWILVCHAAHLDYMFDMSICNPSLGKRLKKVLKQKIYSFCLVNKNNALFEILPTSNSDKKVAIAIPGNPKDSFDAVILHS